MVRYEVTLEVDGATAAALEAYMRTAHIPEIYATGCFTYISFERSSTRFRTGYAAATRADLDRYLREHAPRVRAEFERHAPPGVVPAREIWTEVERWPVAGP